MSKLVAMTFEEASRWIAAQEKRIEKLEAAAKDAIEPLEYLAGMLTCVGGGDMQENHESQCEWCDTWRTIKRLRSVLETKGDQST